MKQLTKVIVVSCLLLLVVAPRASAQSGEALKQVCGVLTGKGSEALASIDAKKQALQAARNQRLQIVVSRRDQTTTDIELARLAADKARQTSQAKLTAKYQETHPVAVQEYISAVTNAVTTRRTAVDSARTLFHQQTDALRTQHTTEIDMHVLTLQNAAIVAQNTLETNCETDILNNSARAAFIQDLKTARLAFRDARRAQPDYTSTMKEYIENRNKSFQEAIKVFEQAMQTARSTFLEALKKS